LKIRTLKHPLSVAAFALFALAATPALHASSACPTPVLVGGSYGSSGGEGLDTGYTGIITGSPATANITCNVLITFNANGSITTTNPNGNGFYDSGGDDNVVGVINNTGSALTSLNLSSTLDIFGFDGDGICGGYNFSATGATCGAEQGDTSNDNYLPTGVTATNINGSDTAGTINFLNGGIAPGGTGFFSLEDPVDLNLKVTPGVPEPSTLLMMGTGIAGFAGMLRRKFGK
jgi:PEP-CTERM motif